MVLQNECLHLLKIEVLITSHPQCDDVRKWGLWELISFRWCLEGGVLLMGLVSL